METCEKCDQEVERENGDWVNNEETENRDQFWCQSCVDTYVE